MNPMRKLIVILLTLACAYSCFAAEGKSVSYKSGDENVQGMLYTPAGKGPFPAIIVIHEWWDWTIGARSKPPSSRTKAKWRWGFVFIAARGAAHLMKAMNLCGGVLKAG